MPRSANYYDNPNNRSFSTVTPQQSSSVVTPNKVDKTPGQTAYKKTFWNSLLGINKLEANKNLPPLQRTQKLFDPNYPINTSYGNQVKYGFNKGLKIAGGFASGFIKAPLNLAQGALALEQTGLDKLTGYQPGKNPTLDAFRINPNGYNLPYLGKVQGIVGDYNQARQLGLSPTFSVVNTIGKTAGDLAVTAAMSEAIGSAFKPRMVTVGKLGAVEDARPLTAEEIKTVRDRINPEDKVISAGNTSKFGKFKPNTDTKYLPMSKSAASNYGGNANNTFLKITPMGGDVSQVDVVQLRKSLANMTQDYINSKFGRGNVVEGAMGPEVKVDSTVVKYNPDFFNKPIKSVPTDLKDILPAMNNITPDLAEPIQKVVESMQKPPLPSIVSKPLKGLEKSQITDKQVEQITGLTDSKGLVKIKEKFPNIVLQSIIKTLTGKSNIYELNQQEAYDVSETVRNFASKGEQAINDTSVLLRSYTDPTRYWMEDIEHKTGIPVFSQVFLPIETGIRLVKIFEDGWQKDVRDVFGKYADTKYTEEQRLINEYTKGNKNVITKNNSLTPEVKTDLVKIGDWLIGKYKDFYNDPRLEINSKGYYGKYAPEIAKKSSGGLYKTKELPNDLTSFFNFSRQGSLKELEDNPLALFDIFTRSVGKKLLLKEPLDNAVKETVKMPDNIKNATNDYIQEVLGYKDKMSEFLDNFSKQLHKNASWLPEDSMNKLIDGMMTTSYAGALGLPRLMPILRNSFQVLFTSYPELGPKYTAIGMKMYNEQGSSEPEKNGFLVPMGVPYGRELTAETTNIGNKALKGYMDFNRKMMTLYGSADVRSRSITYFGVKQRFLDAWSEFTTGKIDWNQFAHNINLDGFGPILQREITTKLTSGNKTDLPDVVNTMITAILDRTQFPYRKGSESRLHFGLKGKLGLQFSQWIWEYTYTIKNWAKRGQWQKIIRWLGMGTAVKRSIEQSTGINVEKWVLGGPFSGFPLGPIGKMAISAMQALGNASSGMDNELNKNWKDILNSMKIYGGVLSGVGAQKIAKFYQSIERYQAGVAVSTDPNPDNKFGVWSSTGKLIRWESFSDLLKTLMGFTPEVSTAQSNKIKVVERASIKYKMKVNDAMNALVDGNYNKFNNIVTKNNLMISDISATMKSYNISLDQRIFDRLPLQLKDKYLNLFYPKIQQ